MNTVAGRVVVKETNEALEGLVVVAYDVDGTPSRSPDGSGGAGRRDPSDGVGGRRLGSEPTDDAGRFQLLVDDQDFLRSDGRRPDLLVVVLAPEAGGDACPVVLHRSCEIRRQAGRRETYVIRIPQEAIRAVGLSLSSELHLRAAKAPNILAHARSAAEARAVVDGGIREIARGTVETERKLRGEIAHSVRRMVGSLSALPAEPGARVVRATDSVVAATARAVGDGLSGNINRRGRRGYVALSPVDLEALRDASPTLTDLPADVVEPILFGMPPSTDGEALELLRDNPLAVACRDKVLPADRCTDHQVPAETPTDASIEVVELGEVGGGENGVRESADALVARMLSMVQAPEDLRAPGRSRAGAGDVDDQVNAFQLRSGPADTPAYFDFHSLQIAFEHVWQEVFDGELQDLIADVYRRVVELGGDPGSSTGNGVKGLLDEARLVLYAARVEPPASVVASFEIRPEEWRALSAEQRRELEALAESLAEVGKRAGLFDVGNQVKEQLIRAMARHIIEFARAKLAEHEDDLTSLHENLAELERRLGEQYAFTVYAANKQERSVNFGLVVTYRQRWEPLSYQAGPLVKTIPLAPKETRKYSKKQSLKTTRTEREVRSATQSRQLDQTDTSRDVADIVRRAQQTTAFEMSSGGGFNLLLKNAKVEAGMSRDAEQSSEETKQRFREGVRKAVEEYRHEHQVEVTAGHEVTMEAEESGEIGNPNDEIPVTYLFYELQRRYRVSERIHRLTPVIFVAQEVPEPEDITEAWLLSHEWILRRALLDDTLLPAFAHLATVSGDELALRERRKHLDQQRKLVDDLKDELVVLRSEVEQRYGALEHSINRRAAIIGREDAAGFLQGIGRFLFGASSSSSEEAARIREEAAKDAHERAQRAENDLTAKVERQLGALTAANDAYTAALSEHLNRKAQLAQLRVHVKENILYYMHAIWDHEPPDQRFFRLHEVKVPRFGGTQTYSLSEIPDAPPQPPFWTRPLAMEVNASISLIEEWAPLAQVADLDTLLGYKGNYMIFPLREANPLTRYMMAPYVDAYAGLRDPDLFGNFTLDELTEYVCCLKAQLDPEDFDRIVPEIHEAYEALLSAPRRVVEDVVIPTGSLFIEALPGAHPVLEDYKLASRIVDLRKAQAELRGEELNNIRFALRLLDGDYHDPSIDKSIVITGPAEPVIDAGGGGD